MKRFQWKVISLMLFTCVISLGSSVIFVNFVLQETVSLGLDERVGNGLERSTEVYRSYIALRKRAIPWQTSMVSHDERLQKALGQPGTERLRALLVEHAKALSTPEQGVSRVVLAPKGVAVSSGESAPPGVVVVERGNLYPRDRWRPKESVAQILGPNGASYQLRMTFVVPMKLFEDYRTLGKLHATFDNMERLDEREETLTRAYVRSFLGISLMVLLLTLALGAALARATTRRLQLLAHATERLAKGELDFEVPVRGQDEIAQLTVAFNAMVVEVRQARDRLAYLERVSTWQEIARRLAHEIKNPLTPILLAVQQLDNKFESYIETPERYRRLVSTAMEIVSEEVESLRQLVREFSEFARLPRVTPSPTDLRAYLEEVLRTNPQFDTHLAPTEFALDAAQRYAIPLDHTMMRRVLINLLQNACDAVDETQNGPENTIVVRARLDGDTHAILEIEDRGSGIKPQHLEKLFDPYFTTKSHGTGLGLAIVRKIIIDHGGDIRATSPATPQGGTRFTIVLPQQSGAEPEEPSEP